jgi:hypothetical protein
VASSGDWRPAPEEEKIKIKCFGQDKPEGLKRVLMVKRRDR